MLAIAYHNLATEEEACKNSEAALQAYLRAYNLVREYNPPQHELCQKFGLAYEDAKAVTQSAFIIANINNSVCLSLVSTREQLPQVTR